MGTDYGEAARLLEHELITGRASGNIGPSATRAFKLAIQLLLATEQKQKEDLVVENKFGGAYEYNRL